MFGSKRKPMASLERLSGEINRRRQQIHDDIIERLGADHAGRGTLWEVFVRVHSDEEQVPK
jgi:hypothetical protein